MPHYVEKVPLCGEKVGID